MIYLTGALASAVTFSVHVFVGGRFVARPLLADKGLPTASKWLNYYCWHVTTLLLAWLTLVFVLLAVRGGALVTNEWLWLVCGLTAACSVLSAGVALRGHIHPLKFPSTTLFAIIALVSGFAAWGM